MLTLNAMRDTAQQLLTQLEAAEDKEEEGEEEEPEEKEPESMEEAEKIDTETIELNWDGFKESAEVKSDGQKAPHV